MLFNSAHFIIFFIIFCAVYWKVPDRQRWVILLLGSLIFYSSHIPEYLTVLLFSVLFNYYMGLRIGRIPDIRSKRKNLNFGVAVNLLLLAVFKYSDEMLVSLLPASVSESTFNSWFLVSLSNSDTPFFSIIMPLGISFFTFTNISYLIDVKRGTTIPEKHAGFFAVFVTFFPKLIQGPIERANHFLPQVREPRHFSYSQAVDGLRLILWGFVKKLVIADRIGVAVDHVFENPEGHSGPVLLYAAVLYSFQIYFDFSAYIDIGRGAAKVLGFELFRNFNLPYSSTSVKEFWDRWHMSLSTWLRDYIFLPVAFSSSRKLTKEKYLNIRTDQVIYAIAATVTFLLAGLWHGTGWNYIIWGGLFAFYLVTANLTLKIKKRFYRKTGLAKYPRFLNFFQIIITFSLITFAWIFFRSESFQTAIVYISGLTGGWSKFFSDPGIINKITFPGFTSIDLVLSVLLIFMTELAEASFYSGKRFLTLKMPPRVLRWSVYYSLLMLIFLFGKFDSENFIYFQF